MDVAGAIEKLVADVGLAAKDKGEAVLLLKQATLSLQGHLDRARLAAGEEQAVNAAQRKAPPSSSDAALLAEQKRAAAAKQARLSQPVEPKSETKPKPPPGPPDPPSAPPGKRVA